VHEQALVAGTRVGHPRDGEPTKKGRSHVVGVPLELGSQAQEGVGIEVDLGREQTLGSHESGHDCRARRAHAAAVRDVVVRAQSEAGHGYSRVSIGMGNGLHHQVARVGGDRSGAVGGSLADNLDERTRLVANRDLKLVVVPQSQTESIETGPEVGGGSGYANRDGTRGH
jgi:hypothetical protein